MGPALPKVPGGAWIQHGRPCAQAPHGPLHASSKLGRVCIREDNQASPPDSFGSCCAAEAPRAVSLPCCRQPVAGAPALQHLLTTILRLSRGALPAVPGAVAMSRRSSRPAFVQGAKRKRACPATDACDSEDDLRIKPGCAQDKSSHQPNCDIIMFDDDVRVSPAKCER